MLSVNHPYSYSIYIAISGICVALAMKCNWRYFATLSTNQLREVFHDEKPVTPMPFTMLLSLVPTGMIGESNCLEHFD
jgi:hypothetical protein